MDLALNNLQRLICHKTQQTNKQTKHPNCFSLVFHNTPPENIQIKEKKVFSYYQGRLMLPPSSLG